MKRTVTIIMILFAFFSLSSAQITIDGEYGRLARINAFRYCSKFN